jgi:hypothetical protein
MASPHAKGGIPYSRQDWIFSYKYCANLKSIGQNHLTFPQISKYMYSEFLGILKKIEKIDFFVKFYLNLQKLTKLQNHWSISSHIFLD